MFAQNKSKIDFATNSFARYREENNFLITHLNNVLRKIEKLKNLGDHEKKDIVGMNFFGVGHDNLDKIFDALDLNADNVVKLIKKLIENLEKEKKELNEHFSKLNHNQIENINHLENLLIRYNQEQYDMVQQLNTYIPNIIELSEGVLGAELRTFKDAANNFITMFHKITYALLHGADRGHLYFITTKTLRALDEYRHGFHQDFITAISDIRAKKFAENFFNLGSQFTKDLNKRLKDANIKDDDSFNDIKDDDEKFAKFMKGTLEKLFTGINIPTGEGEDTKDPKKLIADTL